MLARLEAYASQGKEVFIWTGGDLEAAAAKFFIQYRIKAKRYVRV